MEEGGVNLTSRTVSLITLIKLHVSQDFIINQNTILIEDKKSLVTSKCKVSIDLEFEYPITD